MHVTSWLGWAGSALLAALVLGVLAILATLHLQSHKQKKLLLKRRLRHAWRWLEEHGYVEKTPALIHDYHRVYPELAILEGHFEVVRKECCELMAAADRIPHVQQSGGQYTTRGIHRGDWKTFMLKSGRFLEKNCARAPETTRLLRRIPGVETAFFSILGPHQHLRAHWGYYKGFLRYHLALVVPDENRDGRCWLRVNDDRAAYDRRIRSVIEETPKYHWREGEGIVFDDTCLHDAANESDSPRAVLYLDLRRPLPRLLRCINVAIIALARLDPGLRSIHRDAVMKD